MWDWFDHEEDKEEKSWVLDFTPITRTKDPTAVIDADGETATDLFDEEDKLFELKNRKYMADKEMDLGFPDDQQEFVAKRCLKEVLEEYNSYTKGRDLKQVAKGMGLMLHGDQDFFL